MMASQRAEGESETLRAALSGESANTAAKLAELRAELVRLSDT